MSDPLQNISELLPGIYGLIANVGLTILTLVIGGSQIIKKLNASEKKSEKKAESTAEEAKSAAEEAEKRVMDAMQMELSIVRGSLENVRKENTKLQQTIHTIITAMRTRGMHITILGEMIDIQDSKGGSTTTRIQENR